MTECNCEHCVNQRKMAKDAGLIPLQLVEKPTKYICCDALEKALGDHRGLYSQTIGSMTSDKLDSVIMYIGGDFKIKNPALVQYCPFCGKPRIRASEATK